MPNPQSQWLKRLHPKRLDPPIGPIAGLASAVSVIVGFIAQSAMGHGWDKASIALLARYGLMLSIERPANFATGASTSLGRP